MRTRVTRCRRGGPFAPGEGGPVVFRVGGTVDRALDPLGLHF